jgi:flagellin-like hook-associated protein FlgL
MTAAVEDYDADFENFLRYELFESDGSITQANMQRFVDTLQEAMREEIRLWNPGEDVGVDYLVIDFDYGGYLYIGFTNDFYSITGVVLMNAFDPTLFDHVFFYQLFGGIGSSELTFNRAGEYQEGGESQTPETTGIWLQAGSNASDNIQFHIEAMDAQTLGLVDENDEIIVDVFRELSSDIRPLLNVLDNALSIVSVNRSALGAMQNHLEFTMQNLDIAAENLSASKSRIRDADMAAEMMRLTRANVLQQAAVAMLAQANTAPQAILQLLV